jgi:superfamily I DNA/RNA helicase
MVIAEVKGGTVERADGRWFSTDQSGIRHEIKSPFEQAKASKYALLQYLKDRDLSLSWIGASHLAIFPNSSVVGDLGPEAPRAIIWDEVDLTDPTESLRRTLTHWGQPATSLTGAQLKSISERLAPTIQIRSRLRSVVGAANEEVLELTNRQIEILSGMKRNRRTLIYGSAGTGKTVLAVEKARQLAKDGFDVLWTCFNRPLADSVEQELAGVKSVRVSTFHALCRSHAKAAHLTFPEQPTDEWWNLEAPVLLLEALSLTGFTVDAVVLDEAQDFSNDALTALQYVLKDPDDGVFCMFADPHQEIYQNEWQVPGRWHLYDLTVNCRNTLPVAQKVAQIFGDPVSTLRGATGEKPEFVEAASEAIAMTALREILDRFLQEEMLKANQIVVLSGSRPLVDRLHGEGIGKAGIQYFARKGVFAETIHRFKGLEADVVVLLLHGIDLGTGLGRMLAYIGMSRARGHLVVVGTKEAKKQMAWSGAGPAELHPISALPPDTVSR